MSITDQAPAGPGMTDRIEAVLAKTPTGLLINGEWRDAADGGTFEVENPATGEVIARMASATREDAQAAMDAAADAQESWARTPARERS
ncbi:aldehyde dehydrogenase family protein, partial [Kocuria arenosa]|uniref:aldehyde dehydrogenase family protein n=1 Tax=Kocuria arenosa TaxID=3071446 RepID=UPI0034D7B3C2